MSNEAEPSYDEAAPHFSLAVPLTTTTCATLLHAIPEIVLITRLADGLILELSDLALHTFGYTRATVIGQRIADLSAWVEPSEQRVYLHQLHNKGVCQDFPASFRTPDGQVLPMLLSGRVINLEGEPCILTVARNISEWRRMEEALQASRERYRTLVQNVPLAIYRTTPGPRGAFLMANRTLCAMLNYTDEELRQIAVADVYFDPAERKKFSDYVLKHETVTNVELQLRRKDGSVFWGAVNAQVVRDENGAVTYFDCTMDDVTHRKRAEAAEHEQRALAEALRDTAAALSSTLNFDEVLDRILENVGHIVPYDNASVLLMEGRTARFVRMHGYTIAGTEAEIMAYRFNLDTTDDLRSCAETGEPVIIPNVAHYPAWIAMTGRTWIQSHLSVPIHIKNQAVGFLSLESATPDFFSPQHARHLHSFATQAAVAIENAQLYQQIQQYAEQLELRVRERTSELAREQQRLRAILDTAGEGIFFTDQRGIIEFINPAMERLTGYSSAEVLGHNPNIWRSGRTPPATFNSLWHTILRGDVWQGEMVNRRKDETLYDAALIVAPLVQNDQQITGFVAIARDVTRQKELDRLKDQFVANVSHELRTPLTNVQLHLNLLEHGATAKRDQYLQTLKHEVNRLEALIENLLSLSRLDMGKLPITLGPIDLNHVVTQLSNDRHTLIVESGLRVTTQLASQLPPAHADEMLLAQVLANLMTNAMHYTPPGGQITLSTAQRRQDDVEWISVSVSDTGPGISAQDLPHLFERFYRGEVGRRSGAPGTGLGLAICHDIVQKLNGQITVDSQPGHGASFTVWLRSSNVV